jgi:hypothetical protein
MKKNRYIISTDVNNNDNFDLDFAKGNKLPKCLITLNDSKTENEKGK